MANCGALNVEGSGTYSHKEAAGYSDCPGNVLGASRRPNVPWSRALNAEMLRKQAQRFGQVEKPCDPGRPPSQGEDEADIGDSTTGTTATQGSTMQGTMDGVGR